MRFDLGAQFSDALIIDIVGVNFDGTSPFIIQSQNLSVWFASTTDYLAWNGTSYKCAENVGVTTIGGTLRVTCPSQPAGARYVTIRRIMPVSQEFTANSGFLSLLEVTVTRSCESP